MRGNDLGAGLRLENALTCNTPALGRRDQASVVCRIRCTRPSPLSV